MEFIYTYAVSAGITLYLSYVLISAVGALVEGGRNGWLECARGLLFGLACAIAGGTLAYLSFPSLAPHDRWALVLGLAAVAGGLSTLAGDFANRGLDVDAGR